MRTVVGVDVGGTQLRAALFPDGELTPSRHVRALTRAEEGPEEVVGRLIDLIRQVVPDRAAGLRIGIGAPGPLDPKRGVILESPNLPGWKQVPLRQRVSDAFGCPVVVENDANLAALAEWRHGAGQGTNDMIYLTISTGIGGGVISGGRLISGRDGLGAEPGHMSVTEDGPMCGCGQPGHLEAVAAGPAIARHALELIHAGEPSSLRDEMADHPGLTAEQVGLAAQAGDGMARRVLRDAGMVIGRHLASLVHVFNPECIVLGGGVTRAGTVLFDAIRASLEKSAMHPAFLQGVRVVPAALGDDAGLVGAMLRAREL